MLSSFAPLAGITKGLSDWQSLQSQEQEQAIRQFALQQAQTQQQGVQAAYNALLGGAGALPQPTGGLPQPFQPLTSPQQPQAPAPTGGGGGPLPGFQLPQVPSYGPLGGMPIDPGLGFAGASGYAGLPGGLPTTLPGLDGTTYGVGGPLGPSFPQAGLGMPNAFSGLTQQALAGGPSTLPGFDGTTYGVGLPQAAPPTGQPQDSYAPDPLTGQIVAQPPITTGYWREQQQQPQAPAPVGAPGPAPQVPSGLPPQTPSLYADGAGGGSTQLFANTILPLESGGNMDPIQRGTSGEIGPAQIMPDTWNQYARPGEQIDNPQDNLRVGNRIAADLWQKSGGDPAAVLVGYNAGEGAMRRFQASGDDPRSVRLAPTYQDAVARQQGQRTYADFTGHVRAAASPQEQALGRVGAQNTLAQMPNPLAFAGRIDPTQLARVIERTNPGLSVGAKVAAFQSLYPMLSKVGQEQFQQAWEQYKYTHLSAAEEATAGRAQETKDWERYKFTHPSAGELLTAGKAAAPEVVETPQGLMQWDPQQRKFVPSSLPAGTHKLGTERTGAGKDQAFTILDKSGQPVGEPFMAHRGSDGQYLSAETNEPISVDTAGGEHIMPFKQDTARLQQQQQRMIGAANTAVFYLNNITRLPITASRGMFMGVESKTPEGLVEALKRNFVRQSSALDTKEMQQSAAGLGRVFGMLETQGGLQGMQTYGNMIEAALTPQAGDPPILTMRRMAEMRGIIERAAQAGQAQTKDPKVIALLETVRKEASDSVPYTMNDVADLEDSIRSKGEDPADVVASGAADESIRKFSAKVLKNMKVDARAPDLPAWATGSATGKNGEKIFTDGTGWFHADPSAVQ